MADTVKEEEKVDIAANGEATVENPAAEANGAGDGEAEKVKGDAKTEDTTDDSKDAIKKDEAAAADDSKDATNGDKVAEEGVKKEEHDAVKSEVKSEGSRSPEHKRKDDHDHYRDDRKRNRNGGNNYQQKKYNSNIKTRFDQVPESQDAEEIRNQVEFYFSDSNLPIDAYLLGLSEGSENKPVPLKTIHSFKRMRHFQPFSAVRDAVKQSRFLQLDDEDNITRTQPLDKKFSLDANENRSIVHSNSMARSIYAKGFGEEHQNTFIDIEAFFDPYGPTSSIRLRRHEDGEFKGSVFVEFKDQDTQQKFLDLDPKPKWGEGENEVELQVMSKQEYVDTKNQGILDGDVKPKGANSGGYYYNKGKEMRGGRGGNRGRGGDRGRDRRDNNRNGRGYRDRSRSPDSRDWKTRRDRDQRDGNRNDRRGGRDQRGGRGRGKDGRNRGQRRYSDDRSRSRSPYRKDREDRPSRAEAEEAREKVEKVDTDETKGGAEDSANGESKKRAREDDGEGAGEAKKAKAEEAKVEVEA